MKTHRHLHGMQQNLEKLIAQRTFELTRSKASLEQNIKTLKKSEKRLRLVFENANEAIAVVQDEVVKYCNSKITELTGYSIEEIHSINFSEFIHPEDRGMVMHEYQARLTGDQPKNSYTFRIITKDGQKKFVLVNSALVEWDDGPATLSMITDISPLKKVESDLRRSEERFRNLVEQSPMAIELLTPEGKIFQVNSAWSRMWGVDDEETTKAIDKYNMLTDPQLKDLGVMSFVERAFNGESVILPPIEYNANRAVEDFKIEDVTANAVWVQSHLSPVKDENQEVLFVVNTYVDITELKKTEEEAQKQREAVARINRATRMGQLTGSIAHEVNQPLTGILSSAQAVDLMIKKGNWKTEELSEIMGEIINDTKRAGEVIRNLRELYQEQKIEFLPFDMNLVIKNTTRLLNSEFISQQVVLNTELDQSIPAVEGNKIQIQQVVVNLVMNGVEAMSSTNRDQRKLTITSNDDKDEVLVEVVDWGTGIDADKIDHIFEPLATWKPGGTGMGLAICNSIIKSHGGRMWTRNRTEGGAVVGFSVPVTSE